MTRAAFAPKSLNREARTVDVVLSSGAPVKRHGFEGPYSERLEINTRAINLSNLPVSLLDTHRQGGVDNILGSLIAAKVEGGQLVGTVRISARHPAILDDIETGVIRSLSIGYSVQSYSEKTETGGQKVKTATSWTLIEASFVSVPADPLATVRSLPMPQTTETQTTTPTPAPVQTRAMENREIRALATTLNLPASFADGQIDREATIEQARAAAIAEVQTRATTPGAHVTAMHQIDSPDAIRTRMAEALFARSNLAHKPSEAARPYMAHTLLDVARDCLTRANVSINGMTPADIITRSGMHSTSDFPEIIGDTVNRALRAGYDTAPATLKAAAKQTTAKDFRNKTSIQLSEAPTLEQVGETGSYKHGTMEEAKETYPIGLYGKVVAISRRAMINDDVGAFTDMRGKFGKAAAEFEAQFLVDLLVANAGAGPNMDDGAALFHASHGNLAGTGAVLSETTLGAARLAMRTQKGLTGKPINVTPKFLIVPPQLETTAEKLLAVIQATKSGDVNPFGGKLELLVEARLPSVTRWYIAADPATMDGLEYAYLQGEEGPQVETRVGFETDGIQFKVRLDFGAGFLDHRGWFSNPGA
ncbi:peptidase U35 (plasmid) [Pseudorhodobacter turbinis]|uniref:Peptidase U35 n=2 Tax=Pseudorhodobacter turbinis TaxID=2500533 RepID=A0A4P8EL12_9RHOB|nr:peptidase U35 [Pseudorhodobacter turbinis]